MPAPETDGLYQRAVLWAATGAVDAYGQQVVGLPVEIAVRWLTKRREVLDKQGNTIALDATATVGQDIAVGSRMLLGTLSNYVGTGSGMAVTDEEVMEVKTFDSTPDVKGRYALRSVGLMRMRARE